MSLSRAAALVAIFALGAPLAGCSGSSALTTGTLLGSSSKAPAATAAAPPPETPTDRAVHVATASARAQRCGYVFDPASVRQGFLANEAQLGTTGDVLAKAEKSYDFTVATIGKAIAGNSDYCDDDTTAGIKRDLGKVLAGDFSAPAKRAAPTSSNWWGAPGGNDKFDRDKILHPGRAN